MRRLRSTLEETLVAFTLHKPKPRTDSNLSNHIKRVLLHQFSFPVSSFFLKYPWNRSRSNLLRVSTEGSCGSKFVVEYKCDIIWSAPSCSVRRTVRDTE